MKYIAKDQIKKLIVNSKEFLIDGITIADIRPVLLLVQSTKKLASSYSSLSELGFAIITVMHGNIEEKDNNANSPELILNMIANSSLDSVNNFAIQVSQSKNFSNEEDKNTFIIIT